MNQIEGSLLAAEFALKAACVVVLLDKGKVELTTPAKEVQSFEELFYETALYEQVTLPADLKLKFVLMGYESLKFEGYCDGCGKEQPFSVRQMNGSFSFRDSVDQSVVAEQTAVGQMRVAYCARDESHRLQMIMDISGLDVKKIGQFPSLADIGNAEIKKFRGVLSKQDLSELHKAIGLGAHGVGVGSFVYLRRIFERLIQSRFDKFQEVEGWDGEAFKKARMDEKVGMIRSHIPDILYDYRKVYAVLSKGIHELSEEECLAAFPWLKKSIIFILDDDLRKKEVLEQREEIAKALANF